MEFQEGSLLRIFHRIQDSMYETGPNKSMRIQYMTVTCNCGDITIRDRVYQVHLSITADKDAWISLELENEFNPGHLTDIVTLVSDDLNQPNTGVAISCGFREIKGYKCEVQVNFERERKKWFID